VVTTTNGRFTNVTLFNVYPAVEVNVMVIAPAANGNVNGTECVDVPAINVCVAYVRDPSVAATFTVTTAVLDLVIRNAREPAAAVPAMLNDNGADALLIAGDVT
jgi:hypothetical protein